MKTANNLYDTEDLYADIKLSDWANHCHRELSLKSRWKYQELVHGQFGFDNMIMSVGHSLDNIDLDNINRDLIADLVHEGWAILERQ